MSGPDVLECAAMVAESHGAHETAKALREFSRDHNRVVSALQWVGEHAYAGGKRFADVEPVKGALARVGAA
ncbi:hypothetical protein [Bradyrhizobium sp. 613_E4_N2_2]|uniref:hypothetical protein n=1 Tax=Bradyrhizobium sp. 613_E4_N2_2 TaxID=3240371 RepID=UPI003F8CCBE0